MDCKLTESNTISTNTLKIIAIIAMTCDHIPYLYENWQAEYYLWPWVLMHSIGRMTAPIFFYLLALGYRRTRDANRYTLRLLVFAFISYVPYIWYFRGAPPNAANFLELNVIFTMLFGLLLLRAAHEVRHKALKIFLIALCLIGGYWCDYGLYGLAMILVCGLGLAGKSRRGTVLGLGAVIMTYVYARTSSWFPNDISPFDSLATLFQTPRLTGSFMLYLFLLIPLVLIVRHRGWAEGEPEAKPGFFAKWGFYIFYPAHITALLLIGLYIL